MNEERGQARLPDHELIPVEFSFLLERLSSWINHTSQMISQVRKVGLPPLFASYFAAA